MDNPVYDAETVCGWLVDNVTIRPEGPPDPYYFGSVVHTMFSASPNLDEQYSPIHGLLRYLLLRRDPITFETIPFRMLVNVYKIQPPEEYNHLMESCRRSVENKLEGKPYSVFPVLLLVQNIRKYLSEKWLNREELALMPLYLLALCGRLKTDVLQTKRECIKLHRKSAMKSPDEMRYEYAGDSLSYATSLSLYLKDLFRLGYSTDEVLQEVTYLGMYQALVRASRTGLIKGIREDLQSETSWLLTEAMSS